MPYKNREDLYAAQRRHREKVRRALFSYLSEKECVKCGEDDTIVLEFDHINPKTKIKNVSNFLSGHYAWATVLKEIEKCQVLCANCHRRKSYAEFTKFNIKSP